VKSEGNVQIVNVPYNTKITLSDTGRKDSGVYKIVAENEFGKDEATVEVTVLCTYTTHTVGIIIITVRSGNIFKRSLYAQYVWLKVITIQRFRLFILIF